MSKDINKEIEEVAGELEKSTQTPKERLFETIKALGPEGIKAKLATLEKSEKELLVSALEEMKKAASPSMDSNYTVGYHKGKVYQDSVIQEDKADDDADEKLVDPKNAKMNHQGDNAPEGFEGQVIKSELEQAYDEVKKSDDMMSAMVSKMCKMGKSKKDIMDKCMSKGLDSEKVSGMIDSAMAEHNDKMHQGEQSIKKSEEESAELEKGKMKMLAEEEQSQDKLDDLQKEKARGDKKKPEALKLEEDNKKNMTKSIEWKDENALLKARTGGRNHHFSVNGYYDEVIAKAEKPEGEELVKSENKKEDINDVIEKGGDASRDELICKSMVDANQKKISGKFVKSFADNEIAQALGLTEEEAKQILGE